ncbi:MAG: aryl-sulfate sulfotransferase [Mycoplasmatota bacterium]|nr:aryl-sulfate sulfotransferase [Mycoplasmatota bacterium]
MKTRFASLKEWILKRKTKLKEIGLFLIIILVISLATFVSAKIYEKVHQQNIVDYDWLSKNVSLTASSPLGENVYRVLKSDDIDPYNENYRRVIDEKYDSQKQGIYDISGPLIIHNLYGTNPLSLNIYLQTEEELSLNYIIYIRDEDDIPEFARTMKNSSDDNLTTIHEYQIIGFVPGYVNTLRIELRDENGELVETTERDYDFTNVETLSQTFATVTTGTSKAELADGLYTILGNDSDDQDYVAMYDNAGVLRAEIPIIGYRAHRILFDDNSMYFSISQSKIVKMSNQGRVEEVYQTGKYQLHHDYTFADDGNLIVLANNTKKDTEEDCIIKIDLETKKVTELVDFEPMFQEYVDTCTLDTKSTRDEGEDGLDWLHLNSIEYVDGDVFLSSRETSSILKVKNIETDPELEYILSAEEIWENTPFANYVYEQIGDFKIHAGQHSVRYTATDDPDIYYLTFFDNNYGVSNSQPDFNYEKIGITNNNPFTGDHSYYYVYKVNEKNKTFELVDSIELVYSGIVSSIQNLDNGNILTDSGTAAVYAEYDENHKLIKSFKLKMNKYMVYRVLKYDFNDFWFED